MKPFVYDLCIIGAGMTGSAAARHASENSNIKVCLIGPQEPQKRKVVTGKEAFGAHYDEARIARTTSIYPVWGTLAQKSIDRYRSLEQRSGIQFYNEMGAIIVGTKGEDFMSQSRKNAKRDGILHEYIHREGENLRDAFPYLEFSQNDESLQEVKNSGTINPRKMVMAQIIVASVQGCDVIRETVTGLIREADGGHRVVTENGRILYARKVLLATNVFTNVHQLLGKTMPKCEFMPQTVSLAEISKEDADNIRNMPVVMYEGKGGPSWPKDYPRNPNNKRIHLYMLPPVKYPDGKFYVKIGHSDAILKSSLKASEVQEWYCTEGDKELEQHLFQLLQGMFKGIKFLSHHGDACVTMVTPTKHPYIDLVTPTLGVVIGDNGWAGKSSDEIGRIAADMILTSKWNYSIPREIFKMKTENTTQAKSKL